MLPGARSVVGVLTVLTAWVPAQGPSPVDLVPVLTSTPFAAPPGTRVTHSVTVSGTGTGTVRGVRMTFTTTVGLDGVTATLNRGTCPVATAQTVVCELGDVDFPAEGVTVTVTGTVRADTPPGTLVQNLVTLTPAEPDADPGDDTVSNAYLVAGASAAAPRLSPSATGRPAPRPATRMPAAAAAGLAGAAAVLVVAAILLWRRRRR